VLNCTAGPHAVLTWCGPQRFPALAEFIAAGVFAQEDEPDDEFVFGLERILDGLAAFITG
jgi:hypothetical protein